MYKFIKLTCIASLLIGINAMLTGSSAQDGWEEAALSKYEKKKKKHEKREIPVEEMTLEELCEEMEELADIDLAKNPAPENKPYLAKKITGQQALEEKGKLEAFRDNREKPTNAIQQLVKQHEEQPRPTSRKKKVESKKVLWNNGRGYTEEQNEYFMGGKKRRLLEREYAFDEEGNPHPVDYAPSIHYIFPEHQLSLRIDPLGNNKQILNLFHNAQLIQRNEIFQDGETTLPVNFNGYTKIFTVFNNRITSRKYLTRLYKQKQYSPNQIARIQEEAEIKRIKNGTYLRNKAQFNSELHKRAWRP